MSPIFPNYLLEHQVCGAGLSQGGDKLGYRWCTGPILASRAVRVQIFRFVGAWCWSIAMSTGHARTDTNNMLLS